ncbi:Assembly factor cbp4 [Zalaria obscura]|uniref:Assembly factor cbp4 n=1 Tax=Zalaria obscura TaxID=2024903 RepID=A0ACC3SLB7_9PEZI
MGLSAMKWVQMIAAGGICCIGGPALIYYVTPTEEELFMRYNPELQRRSLENRAQKQEDFDNFVNRLKQYSKSDKPIWAVMEQEEEKLRQSALQQRIADQRAANDAAEARRLEIKNHSS